MSRQDGGFRVRMANVAFIHGLMVSVAIAERYARIHGAMALAASAENYVLTFGKTTSAIYVVHTHG